MPPRAAALLAFALCLGCGAAPAADGGTDSGTDAGLDDAGFDAGSSCPSNTWWTRGNAAGASMEPGMACLTCHRTEAPNLVYDFMGTVFDGYRTADTCFAEPPPGVTVEILDKDGNVGATLLPNTAGNFFTGRNSGVALPYTARVRFDGGVSQMLTPQTDGDCNRCHTTQGLNGAPGRIVWPR